MICLPGSVFVRIGLHRLHILFGSPPGPTYRWEFRLTPGEPEQTANDDRTAKSIRRLHVAEFDHKHGVPVDPRFRNAADRIEQVVFRYRSEGLTDAAELANIAEQAVYKANWALYGMHCANPAAYVLTIFRRDADEIRKRHSRIVSIDEHPNGYATVASCSQADVERKVLVRELLDSMDNVTRAILLRRVEGERPADIGRTFGMSANAVSIRLSRALAQLRKRVAGHDE
jgi:DNA-directed RNA polymerase specialized sigma24 family protein